jgi:flagellar L-ring protein precursor FlgH
MRLLELIGHHASGSSTRPLRPLRRLRALWRLLFSCFILCCAGGAIAQTNGSLWDDDAKNPFTDRIAKKVGDVLTVIVAESSAASSTASTQASKKDDASVSAGVGPILRALIPKLGSSSDFKSQGQGSTSRSGNLTARLTVIVKGTLPGGNLVIEGTRYVQVNKEFQKMTITGVVRPDDINFDNTILSEFIANADIRFDGKGTVGDRQRKGLISQLLDWLF